MSQRDDLLAGAKRCLVDKGYGKTTARDIAAASGAHLASIGYHFGSKDNLMNTAVMEASGDWADSFQAAVSASRAQAPEQRMRALVGSILETLPRERDLLVASVQAYSQAQFDGGIREMLATNIGVGRRELAALILGREPDDVDPETAAGLGSMVYNVISGFVIQFLVDPDALPTVDQAMDGLRALTTASD
ncbi:TetR/AcrR family transcriptional regulator [Nocardiopsis sp. CT-R113]|uniref:TetR/AcrR family transcriptional regulator n=1 Tax=Nocardiopsis codii TaxID=3065942 RepID=A0ABU7KFN8_9ACTN|nr:TetR/AcrR family transcriptional regulator [Nocardiopsis sp. CT-R113]MEE2041056.1 TetR/AcrR family transcriptional regulator [Nocardiopsis sp. CT-R113]